MRILQPVLIASFLDQEQLDAVWLQGTCSVLQNNPNKTNIYFQFNHKGALIGMDPITRKFTEFTAMNRVLARAFIVLECDIVDNNGDDMGA